MGAAKKVGGVTAAAAAVGAATFGLLPIEQRALVQQALTGECPRTVACLEWEAPTKMTDGTNIPTGKQLWYTVYRGTSATLLQPVANTQALTMVVPNTGPTNVYFYGVKATVMPDNLTSALSDTVSKLVRAPGPTDGRIEGPTDGGIED